MRTEEHTALECYRSCTETIQYCLSMGGDHVEQSHLNLLMDCAVISATMTDFLIRDSEFSASLAPLCAEICDACAESCEEVGGEEDEEMVHCADVCRQCAEMCRQLEE